MRTDWDSSVTSKRWRQNLWKQETFTCPTIFRYYTMLDNALQIYGWWFFWIKHQFCTKPKYWHLPQRQATIPPLQPPSVTAEKPNTIGTKERSKRWVTWGHRYLDAREDLSSVFVEGHSFLLEQMKANYFSFFESIMWESVSSSFQSQVCFISYDMSDTFRSW